MKNIKYLLAILILISSQASYALDNNRKGIIFGAGAGIHSTNFDFYFNNSKYSSDSRSGLATSIKFGAGITNQFVLSYVRNASWYTAPYNDGTTTSDTVYVIEISGFEASYYFSPSAPSGYILGAVGLGSYSAPSEDESDTGVALMIGGGYEISKHLHLEGTLLTTDVDSSEDSRYNLKASSFQFTINYLWY